MPAAARTRPEPAGEPSPTTIDPPPTPIEDLPAGDPPAAPEPESDALPPIGAFHLTPEGAVPIPAERFAGPVFGSPGVTLPPMDESAYAPDAEPLRESYPLTAAEALAEVMRRVRPIAKLHEAEPKAGGYSFRGIDDVYAALHDLFAEVGLVLLPSTLEHEREQRPRASGSGYNYVTHVRVRLRFLAQDGSSEELDVWGEGADTGDKSTGKAYSQGIKSALLAAFLIPTEASAQDDPDRTNTEPSRPFSAEEVARAQRALGAAREADTIEKLAGVRHRALALLDVPVTEADGTVAPLGYLIDLLRQAIEQTSPAGQQS